MPIPWSDTNDRQLLLTIIHLSAPAAPKWDQVALAMGEGFTAEAVRQRYAKIRKNTSTNFESSTSTPLATPTKGTPRKKAASETPSKASKKRKLGDVDEDDEPGTEVVKDDGLKFEEADDS